ncbi:MAG: class I SAM-dependent methyltransferase, partial [Dehalococcoidia bacterium]|nr:class I SAM-dependent methyltransferase [Dehalococcoidia bacterium]
VMIAQRPSEVAAVQAVAEQLPFPDRSFDAAMAVLSVHHWQDPRRGLSELLRVARDRIVVLTWDQRTMESFWLMRRYFPKFIELDRSRALSLDEIVPILGNAVISPVPIPWDCRDGFAGAFWRRPEAYLDPTIRSGISPFSLLPDQTVAQGLQCLTEDLRSGVWVEQFGYLLELDELDIGYRLVVHDL